MKREASKGCGRSAGCQIAPKREDVCNKTAVIELQYKDTRYAQLAVWHTWDVRDASKGGVKELGASRRILLMLCSAVMRIPGTAILRRSTLPRSRHLPFCMKSEMDFQNQTDMHRELNDLGRGWRKERCRGHNFHLRTSTFG